LIIIIVVAVAAVAAAAVFHFVVNKNVHSQRDRRQTEPRGERWEEKFRVVVQI